MADFADIIASNQQNMADNLAAQTQLQQQQQEFGIASSALRAEATQFQATLESFNSMTEAAAKQNKDSSRSISELVS